MPTTILVPFDGSAHAIAALQLAVAIAPDRPQVHLLHVIPTGGVNLPGTGSGQRTPKELATEQQGRLDAENGPLLRKLGAHADLTWLFEFGDPAERILAVADRLPADFIVMGSQGRGTIGRLTFGSVADRVSRHGELPVVLVRDGTPTTRPTRVTVPLDGSPLAENAIGLGADLADALEVPLRLVRVIDLSRVLGQVNVSPLPMSDEAYTTARATARVEADHYLTAIAERLAASGITVETEVREGVPAATLIAAIEPRDLVVLTSHGEGGLKRWLLGSVAEQLRRDSPAPVALVPAIPTAEAG